MFSYVGGLPYWVLFVQLLVYVFTPWGTVSVAVRRRISASVFGFRIRSNITRCRTVLHIAGPQLACARRMSRLLTTCTQLISRRLPKAMTIVGHFFLDSTTGRTTRLRTLLLRDISNTVSVIRRPPLSKAGVTL